MWLVEIWSYFVSDILTEEFFANTKSTQSSMFVYVQELEL